MKNITLTILLLLTILNAGCQFNDSQPEPITIGDPPFATLIGRDSITSGNYLGIGINESVEKTYAITQAFGKTKDITHITLSAIKVFITCPI
jgi:hypothetical protein